MFVLVFAFIFLTATPHYGVSTDLPRVWHPVSMRGANREDALIVSILRDGRIRYEGVLADLLARSAGRHRLLATNPAKALELARAAEGVRDVRELLPQGELGPD